MPHHVPESAPLAGVTSTVSTILVLPSSSLATMTASCIRTLPSPARLDSARSSSDARLGLSRTMERISWLLPASSGAAGAPRSSVMHRRYRRTSRHPRRRRACAGYREPMRQDIPVEQIRRAPKVLLHDHLDGGLRPATVIELARETGYDALP